MDNNNKFSSSTSTTKPPPNLSNKKKEARPYGMLKEATFVIQTHANNPHISSRNNQNTNNSDASNSSINTKSNDINTIEKTSNHINDVINIHNSNSITNRSIDSNNSNTEKTKDNNNNSSNNTNNITTTTGNNNRLFYTRRNHHTDTIRKSDALTITTADKKPNLSIKPTAKTKTNSNPKNTSRAVDQSIKPTPKITTTISSNPKISNTTIDNNNKTSTDNSASFTSKPKIMSASSVEQHPGLASSIEPNSLDLELKQRKALVLAKSNARHVIRSGQRRRQQHHHSVMETTRGGVVASLNNGKRSRSYIQHISEAVRNDMGEKIYFRWEEAAKVINPRTPKAVRKIYDHRRKRQLAKKKSLFLANHSINSAPNHICGEIGNKSDKKRIGTANTDILTTHAEVNDDDEDNDDDGDDDDDDDGNSENSSNIKILQGGIKKVAFLDGPSKQRRKKVKEAFITSGKGNYSTNDTRTTHHHQKHNVNNSKSFSRDEVSISSNHDNASTTITLTAAASENRSSVDNGESDKKSNTDSDKENHVFEMNNPDAFSEGAHIYATPGVEKFLSQQQQKPQNKLISNQNRRRKVSVFEQSVRAESSALVPKSQNQISKFTTAPSSTTTKSAVTTATTATKTTVTSTIITPTATKTLISKESNNDISNISKSSKFQNVLHSEPHPPNSKQQHVKAIQNISQSQVEKQNSDLDRNNPSNHYKNKTSATSDFTLFHKNDNVTINSKNDNASTTTIISHSQSSNAQTGTIDEHNSSKRVDGSITTRLSIPKVLTENHNRKYARDETNNNSDFTSHQIGLSSSYNGHSYDVSTLNNQNEGSELSNKVAQSERDSPLSISWPKSKKESTKDSTRKIKAKNKEKDNNVDKESNKGIHAQPFALNLSSLHETLQSDDVNSNERTIDELDEKMNEVRDEGNSSHLSINRYHQDGAIGTAHALETNLHPDNNSLTSADTNEDENEARKKQLRNIHKKQQLILQQYQHHQPKQEKTEGTTHLSKTNATADQGPTGNKIVTHQQAPIEKIQDPLIATTTTGNKDPEVTSKEVSNGLHGNCDLTTTNKLLHNMKNLENTNTKIDSNNEEVTRDNRSTTSFSDSIETANALNEAIENRFPDTDNSSHIDVRSSNGTRDCEHDNSDEKSMNESLINSTTHEPFGDSDVSGSTRDIKIRPLTATLSSRFPGRASSRSADENEIPYDDDIKFINDEKDFYEVFGYNAETEEILRSTRIFPILDIPNSQKSTGDDNNKYNARNVNDVLFNETNLLKSQAKFSKQGLNLDISSTQSKTTKRNKTMKNKQNHKHQSLRNTFENTTFISDAGSNLHSKNAPETKRRLHNDTTENVDTTNQNGRLISFTLTTEANTLSSKHNMVAIRTNDSFNTNEYSEKTNPIQISTSSSPRSISSASSHISLSNLSQLSPPGMSNFLLNRKEDSFHHKDYYPLTNQTRGMTKIVSSQKGALPPARQYNHKTSYSKGKKNPTKTTHQHVMKPQIKNIPIQEMIMEHPTMSNQIVSEARHDHHHPKGLPNNSLHQQPLYRPAAGHSKLTSIKQKQVLQSNYAPQSNELDLAYQHQRMMTQTDPIHMHSDHHIGASISSETRSNISSQGKVGSVRSYSNIPSSQSILATTSMIGNHNANKKTSNATYSSSNVNVNQQLEPLSPIEIKNGGGDGGGGSHAPKRTFSTPNLNAQGAMPIKPGTDDATPKANILTTYNNQTKNKNNDYSYINRNKLPGSRKSSLIDSQLDSYSQASQRARNRILDPNSTSQKPSTQLQSTATNGGGGAGGGGVNRSNSFPSGYQYSGFGAGAKTFSQTLDPCNESLEQRTDYGTDANKNVNSHNIPSNTVSHTTRQRLAKPRKLEPIIHH